jgi:hypothetical protein
VVAEVVGLAPQRPGDDPVPEQVGGKARAQLVAASPRALGACHRAQARAQEVAAEASDQPVELPIAAFGHGASMGDAASTRPRFTLAAQANTGGRASGGS